MTDAEKLEALIEKALVGALKWNGFNITSYRVHFKKAHLPIYFETDEKYTWTEEVTMGDDIIHEDFNGQAISLESLLFNPDFARALFGEEFMPMGYPFDADTLTSADYYRMRAVISKTPIDYYYQAVFGDKDDQPSQRNT